MRSAGALVLAIIGFALAVALPIVIAIAFDIDLGKRTSALVGGMMPGIIVMVLASKLSKGARVARSMPEQILKGYQLCDLCGKAVLETEGAARQLDPTTPLVRVAFVCHACNRYRNKTALIALVLFLAGLGVLVLVCGKPIPIPQKNEQQTKWVAPNQSMYLPTARESRSLKSAGTLSGGLSVRSEVFNS